MLIKIIRLLYYILFFIVPLAVYSHTSELFEFNKLIITYIITILIAGLWTADYIRRPREIQWKNPMILALSLFLLSNVVSTIFSIDIYTSIFGYYGRFNGGLLSILTYCILAFVFANIFTAAFLKRLLLVSLASSFFVILWGLPGRFGHDLSCLVFTGTFSNECWTNQFRPGERMFSTLGQPNWLGAYLSVHFFIALYFFLSEALKKAKDNLFHYFGLLVYILLNFTGILFTRSDSSLLATVAGLIVFIPALVFIIPHEVRKRVAGRLIILGVGTVLLIVTLHTNISIVDRFLKLSTYQNLFHKQGNSVAMKQSTANNPYSITNITDSWDIRKIVWKGAWQVGMSHPVIGTGVETFAFSYYFKRPVEHNLTSEWDYLYNKAHNEFLNYFANNGLFGLLTYVAFLATILAILGRNIYLQRANTDIALLNAALVSSVISMTVTNFFGFSVTTMQLLLFIIAGVAIAGNSKIQNGQMVKLFRKHYVMLGAVGLVMAFLLFSTIMYFVADMKYAEAETQAQTGEYQAASSLLHDAINLHYEHIYQDKLSYYLANLSYYAAYQKKNDIAHDLIALSDNYNAHTIKISPQNVTYWKTKAKNQFLFYQTTNDVQYIEKGEDALRHAMELAPTDPKLPYSLALYYSLQDDEAKSKEEKLKLEKSALDNVNKTIALKQNYEDAYILKAQLLKKFGKKDEAMKQFQFVLDHINPQNEDALKEVKAL